MFKEQKGITLVALVITIIVLVILVGVTVSVAINSNLIPNSKTAVDKYGEKQTGEEELVNDVTNTVKHYWDNSIGEWTE